MKSLMPQDLQPLFRSADFQNIELPIIVIIHSASNLLVVAMLPYSFAKILAKSFKALVRQGLRCKKDLPGF
jgi:hypothetical protein